MDDKIVCRLGVELVAILRGQTKSLEFMIKNSLLFRFYSEIFKVKRIGSQLSGLLRHLAHKNSRARILEIDASTEGVTRYTLNTLDIVESGGSHASLYHYTDTSAASFEAIRESLLP